MESTTKVHLELKKIRFVMKPQDQILGWWLDGPLAGSWGSSSVSALSELPSAGDP